MKAFLKKYMIAGILVLVPVVATIWVLKTLIVWMDGIIFSLLPDQLRLDSLADIPGLGFVVTIVIILITGIFTRLYVGKKIVSAGDKFFSKLPFGRAIYQAIKQVLHSTLSEQAQKSRRVVLVEYPKAGSYAIGFLTGKWGKMAHHDMEQDGQMVFVPTAPNPTSGFLLIVDEKSLIYTDMSAEEASKLLISGGLLTKKEEAEC